MNRNCLKKWALFITVSAGRDGAIAKDEKREETTNIASCPPKTRKARKFFMAQSVLLSFSTHF